MPIIYRVGQVGSGKSLEMLEVDTMPNLKEDRLVLHNIEGVDHDKVAEYLGLDPDTMRLETYTEEEIKSPSFFYHPEKNPNARTRPGCLLIVDEAGQIWPSKPVEDDQRISPECAVFLAKHRHYTDERGRPIDIVAGTQVYTDVHDRVKKKATKTIETRKLTMFGWSRGYRVRVYEGCVNPTSKSETPTSIKFKKYNPAIFPLYKSAQTASIAQTSVSHNGNLLSKKWMRYGVPLILAAVVWGAQWTYTMFTQGPKSLRKPTAEATGTPGGTKGEPVAPTGGNAAAKGAAQDEGGSPYQLVGWYYAYNGLRVFILSKDGQLTYRTLNDFKEARELGPYLYLVQKDGKVISNVYRPLAASPQGVPNASPPAPAAAAR